MRKTYLITVSIDTDELDDVQAMYKRSLQRTFDAAWPLAREETVLVISVREPPEPSSSETDG